MQEMQDTWVQSLGREGPLEKEMVAHSSFLPGESHGRRSLASYHPWGCKESDMADVCGVCNVPNNVKKRRKPDEGEQGCVSRYCDLG